MKEYGRMLTVVVFIVMVCSVAAVYGFFTFPQNAATYLLFDLIFISVGILLSILIVSIIILKKINRNKPTDGRTARKIYGRNRRDGK